MTDKFTHIPAAYEIVSLEYIDEIKSQAALLRHRKTGARIAVLANDDENKTFNVRFREVSCQGPFCRIGEGLS